ncbi:MAG: PQQ-binding-like beta-propeller repeat protein, partial [Candidatus Thermoplasmatota archaeon]|nr:PQQ-binding-like beta-propeller repeat protein [Candidatus Thermoplasmatota archaeon]
FVGGVALADDRCLVGLERSVRCLDHNGKQLWELRTGQLVRGIVTDNHYVACSSGKRLYCLTTDGNLLWREEVGPLRHLRLVRDGGAILIATDSGTWCFETNGQQLWQVAEEQFIEAAAAVPTGELTTIVTGGEVFGKWELKLLDREGLVLESYSSREEISCLALPEHGGEVVAGIGSRVCWFRNSEFLKRTLTDQLAQVRKLGQKVTAYGPAPPGVEDSLEQVEARVRGSFDAMQEAYSELKACRQALAAIQQQHVEYLDQLPRLMKSLGLPESQPQELAAQLYPLYALYRRLETVPRQQERRINEQLARLKKVAETFDGQRGSEALQRKLTYTSEALQLLPQERRKLRGLMKEQRAAQKRVEKRLRQAVMDWMTSGSVGVLEEFMAQIEQQQMQRVEGEADIRERVRNMMTFAEMSHRFDHLELS